MGTIANLRDGLRNAILGFGRTGDANSYAPTILNQASIEWAYRGSGMMRKVINIPCEDSVRDWREWGVQGADLGALTDEERRLGLQEKFLKADILGMLGGGAIVMGLPGDPATPAPEKIAKGQLAYLHVVNRWQLSIGDMIDDPMDPLYGQPSWFMMNTTKGQQRIHPSRVICLKGDPVPQLVATIWEDSFWGESRIARVKDDVDNFETAKAAFIRLVQKASYLRVGIPNLLDLVGTQAGEDKITKRVSIIAEGASVHNAVLYDAGNEGKDAEIIEDAAVNLSGLSDSIMVYGTMLAATADIPATRLLSKSAQGMNSSGDSEQKDWAKVIKARQSLRIDPALLPLDKYLIQSALGRADQIDYIWPSLDMPTQKEEADRFKVMMDAVAKLQNTGAIPDVAMAKGIQSFMVEEQFLPGLESALEEIPESERYGGMEGGDEIDPVTGEAVDPSALAIGDAAPRSLYVRRDVLNKGDIAAWARGQGFSTTVDDMHVTILYSRRAVDWMAMGDNWSDNGKGGLTIPAGGARIVEPLGDKGAIVLLFASSSLSWRHEDMVHRGASHDFAEYQPHVTITYSGEGVDLSAVKPYRGKIELGPEIFEELDPEWSASEV